MKWILFGIILGSSVSSIHDTREECEGRAVMLRERGAKIRCAEALSPAENNYTLRFGTE